MSSKSSRSNKRSRKNRFSNHFSIESLEKREMFAANLAADMASLFAVNSNFDSHTAAVAAATAPAASRLAVDFNHFGSDRLQDQLSAGITTSLPVHLPLLSATFEGGVLTVTGSNGADNLFIYASEGTVYVREVVKELTLLTVPAAELTSVVVNAHGGDDWVNVDHQTVNVPATLKGGSGNDMLQGGAVGDNLYGDSGNDKLMGHAGDDSMSGGYDDDLLVGGEGNDNVSGNAGDDYVIGGHGSDWMFGEEGNDLLFGEAGDDFLFGGPGQNLLDGGEGNDALYGGEDIDDIYGGGGDDFIMGFSGGDGIRGEAGNDNIFAGDGADIVDGGEGDDTIRGDAGNDALSGGAGNDLIAGGAGHDWINGGAGNDVLRGDAGNDWLQGASGSDLLYGGTGDNKLFQDYAPGAEPTGQLASALSWDDVEDAASDGWDAVEDAANDAADAVGGFLSDIAEWTVDKAEMIAGLYYNWLVNLDDRLVRLGNDLATTLSNWPWESEFWQGWGRVLIDSLEIMGLGEAWQLYCTFYMPWLRGMTDAEIDVARSVFGDSINYSLVQMNEYSVMNAIGGPEAHVQGYIINSNGDISDATMIHELTHVWQYEEDGLIYIPEALGAQSGEGYEYGGVADLRATMDAGQGLSAYNREQQGDIVQDYFLTRQYVIALEADGYDASTERSELDVYIYFVKEVSTLSEQELDVASSSGLPVRTGDSPYWQPTTRTVTSPLRSGATQSTSLALDTAFAELSPTTTSKTATASDLFETLASGSTTGNNEEVSLLAGPSASLVTTSALDVVFGSLA